METATPTAPAEKGTIAEQFAREMDRQAQEEVAKKEGTINEIGQASRRRVENMFGGRMKVAGGDGASAMEGVLPTKEEVQQETDKLQQTRMALIDQDADIKTKKMENYTGGYFSNEGTFMNKDVLARGNRNEIHRIFLHEAKHRKDGVRNRGVDQKLIPETGIPDVDAKAKDTTERNVLEKGAMQAEKAVPRGPYVEEHWKPATELEERFKAAGIDGEAAAEKLQANDLEGFREDTRAMLLQELTKKTDVKPQFAMAA